MSIPSCCMLYWAEGKPIEKCREICKHDRAFAEMACQPALAQRMHDPSFLRPTEAQSDPPMKEQHE